jgi:hypothetical protein
LENNELKTQIKEFLEKWYIQSQKIPWGTFALFKKKKDGTQKMCVNYDLLNKFIIKNMFFLPHIDDLFNYVCGTQIFLKIDLCGFHQIWIKQMNIHKTTFQTQFGHYKFLVMPFGLTNAPSMICV